MPKGECPRCHGLLIDGYYVDGEIICVKCYDNQFNNNQTGGKTMSKVEALLELVEKKKELENKLSVVNAKIASMLGEQVFKPKRHYRKRRKGKKYKWSYAARRRLSESMKRLHANRKAFLAKLK